MLPSGVGPEELDRKLNLGCSVGWIVPSLYHTPFFSPYDPPTRSSRWAPNARSRLLVHRFDIIERNGIRGHKWVDSVNTGFVLEQYNAIVCLFCVIQGLLKWRAITKRKEQVAKLTSESLFIYTFIFCNLFLLVRVLVDLEPNPGSVARNTSRMELQIITVYQAHTCTFEEIHLPACFGRRPENPRGNPQRHGENMWGSTQELRIKPETLELRDSNFTQCITMQSRMNKFF